MTDPRGASFVGLVLGFAAYLVLERGDAFDKVDGTETGLALVSLTLGLVALAFAETAAAEVLLAIFMGSILVVLGSPEAVQRGAFRPLPLTRLDQGQRSHRRRRRHPGAGGLAS